MLLWEDAFFPYFVRKISIMWQEWKITGYMLICIKHHKQVTCIKYHKQVACFGVGFFSRSKYVITSITCNKLDRKISFHNKK